MSTPAASGTLYASPADLRNMIEGTDAGKGTAAMLTDAQLTLALYSASNRVSVYVGNVYDSSTPQATPPAILHDLTLDLAAFWAFKTYRKDKVMANDHPVYMAYKDAMSILEDARDGKVRLDPAPPGSVGSEIGVVINLIPPIFTGDDSNTRVGQGGVLESDTPVGAGFTPNGVGWGDGSPVYQG
jgi:phage gp36-like protein